MRWLPKHSVSLSRFRNKSQQELEASFLRSDVTKKLQLSKLALLEVLYFSRYCECFSSGLYCERCNCTNCSNSVGSTDARQEAVEAVLERNLNAFRPKIASNNIGRVQFDSRHNKGCHCKKSSCLKKYCECFQAKICCTDICRCSDCKNLSVTISRLGHSDPQNHVKSFEMTQGRAPRAGMTHIADPPQSDHSVTQILTKSSFGLLSQKLTALDMEKSKINLRCKRKAESDVDDKPQILPSLIGIPDDSDDVQQRKQLMKPRLDLADTAAATPRHKKPNTADDRRRVFCSTMENEIFHNNISLTNATHESEIMSEFTHGIRSVGRRR